MGKNSINTCMGGRDHIPGDPAVFETLAGTLDRYVQGAAQSGGDLRTLSGNVVLWSGEAADGFRKELGKLPDKLDKVGAVFTVVSGALRGFAGVLRGAQTEFDLVVKPQAQEAERLSLLHQNETDVYDAAKEHNKQLKKSGTPEEMLPPLPAKPPKDDPGESMMKAAEKHLKQLRERVEDAEDAYEKAVKPHWDYHKAPHKKPAELTFIGNVVEGFIDGFTELASFVGTVDPVRAATDPQAYYTDLKSIAGNLAYTATHPVEFAQTTWEEWKKNPGHALGLVLSGGATGAAAKAAAVKLGGKPGSREADAVEKTGDPVDAATGEVLLEQTDVSLPGGLPLLLQRRHRTGFEHGRCFGKRWSSTLDQHLLLGADGVRLVTWDGVILGYPVPEPEVPVLPEDGARWPLRWDGIAGGEFTVTDPMRGWTWAFAPVPGLREPLLPVRSLTDRNGNRIEFRYDESGMPCEVTHTGGYRIAVDSAGGRVTGLRLLGADPATHEVSADATATLPLVRFAYGETGDLAEVVNSSGKPLRFTHDDRHRMTSWTDRNNTWYQYTYDEAGRCLHGVGTDGVMDNTFEYDTDARVTRMTDALGGVHEFHWDPYGRVTERVDPLGNTVRTEWDAFNRKVAVTDPLGHTTRYSYDDPGNLIGVVYPDGTYTVADFDPKLCRPTQIVNPDGTRRRYTWDERGNLLTRVDEAGARTQYGYNASGALIQVTDALGAVTRYAPDAVGLPVSITDPLGRTTHTTRDAFGRTAAITDPLGHTTRVAHTVEGKTAWRELADGTRESWTWDAEGNLLHHQNAAGFTTRHESGAFDLPTAQTGPDGNRYTFGYDAELRL